MHGDPTGGICDAAWLLEVEQHLMTMTDEELSAKYGTPEFLISIIRRQWLDGNGASKPNAATC
jgi:hypothetical protein